MIGGIYEDGNQVNLIINEERKSESEEDNRYISLYGKTGSGKSTLLNEISGQVDLFKVGHDLASMTLHPQRHYIQLKDYKIALLDTPGSADNRNLVDFDLYATIAMTLVEGLDLAFYVISVTSARFDVEDIDGLKMIERLLGTHDNTYIILNQIDRLNPAMQIQTEKTWRNEIEQILS